MEEYTGYSSHASLAGVAVWMQERGIWEQVVEHVHIRQKSIRHTPHEKLKDVFINILAGGQGINEINTRVRSEPALQRAFGRTGCADQSGASQTLNACTRENVQQLGEVLSRLYHQYGQACQHDFVKHHLLLDIDLTGLLAGRQAEGATKGYFSGNRNARGRQVGRVLASQYDEIVCEQLLEGKVQLEKCLLALVQQAAQILDLDEKRRQRTILRVDAGGGVDANINWGLAQGYLWMSKVKNSQRKQKLLAPISNWLPIKDLPGHEAAWVPSPHAYVQPTRQLAVRWPERQGGWQSCLLVFNLPDDLLFELAGQKILEPIDEAALLSAILKAYNRRGGGIETSFKNSRQGLGLGKRNKKSFSAQHMLVLLAQLAYNLLSWIRRQLVQKYAALAHFGILRLLRNLFSITGTLHFDHNNHLTHVVLNQANPFARLFLVLWPPGELSLILGQI